MNADGIRAELRQREDELQALRVKMDEETDANGGFMPRDKAVKYAERLEFLTSEIWRIKGLLRTPCPF